MEPVEGQIDVAVVGLGYFGSHHARQYAAHPGARLVAVVDPDPERAGRAAAAHGGEALAAHALLPGRVRAASITVPTSIHHPVAAELIDAGIHLFIEKPIASDAAAGADLVARAAKRGTVLQIGHIERFSPVYRAVESAVRAPKLIECARRFPWKGRALDVDVVLDLMIHDIDMALALARAPVAKVEASGVSVVTPLTDVAEARLTFANGVVATFAASRVANAPERTLTVTEPRRRFFADLAALRLTTTEGAGESERSGTEQFSPVDALAAEIDAFIGSVSTGRKPVVDGAAGVAALDVADRIRAAIAARAAISPGDRV